MTTAETTILQRAEGQLDSTPATTLITKALAQRKARKGPVMLLAPSWLVSAKRLTTPINSTNPSAGRPLRRGEASGCSEI